MRLSLLTFLIAMATLLTTTQEAKAYPQFQLSTENAYCGMCHFSPTGGGLINGWGRRESSDTISRGGEGDFFHDVWEPPSWLQLGGDYRGAAGLHDSESTEIETLLFPMQLDLYTRFRFGDFSFNTTIGARGSARPRDPPPHSRVASREHYFMWQPSMAGPYVRAGRFYAPYGLRQVDHTTFIRRDLGFYAWEETYGVSGGYVQGNDWEAHLSAFIRDPLLKVGPEGFGVSMLYERRFAEHQAAYGVQSKVQIRPDAVQYWAGGTFKYWIAPLNVLLLSEIDLSVQDIDSPGAKAVFGGIAHLNLSMFITQGVMLGTTLEAKHNDFRLRGKDAEAASLSLQYFPRAHFEIMLLGKVERTRNTHDLLSLLMLHYYL
jgi:hypothetical protein